MPNEPQSFNDLLNEAPLSSETVTLTGVLARSRQKDKFVLTLADGRSLTLDINAVKAHRSLGSSIGLPVVAVDLDLKQVPSDILVPFPGTFGTFPLHLDVHTNWFLDSGATGNPRIPTSID